MIEDVFVKSAIPKNEKTSTNKSDDTRKSYHTTVAAYAALFVSFLGLIYRWPIWNDDNGQKRDTALLEDIQKKLSIPFRSLPWYLVCQISKDKVPNQFVITTVHHSFRLWMVLQTRENP
jgi:hypothetical protein